MILAVIIQEDPNPCKAVDGIYQAAKKPKVDQKSTGEQKPEPTTWVVDMSPGLYERP